MPSAASRGSSTTRWSVTTSASPANAAIGVSWQIFLVVIVFISSLFTGMGVLVPRFAGANQPDKVE